MHDNFLIFCDLVRNEAPNSLSINVNPYAVWTGAFNLSLTASLSFENALFVTNPEINKAYFGEREHIMAFSEPLNSESDWCAPEWRMGS